MIKIHVQGLTVYAGIKKPFAIIIQNSEGGALFSKEQWENYPWNPPPGHSVADPDADPKPIWETLVVYHNEFFALPRAIEKAKSMVNGRGLEFIRNSIADTDHLAHDGNEVFVHGGIDRMTGLLQMVENSNESGKPIPYIRMRDEGNQPVNIHTQNKMRPLLDALAHRKNVVESAHNKVMQDYQAIASIRDDETKTLDERLTAGNNAITFLENYRTHLQTAIDAYDPATLPTDLDELRDYYIENLEAVALARQRWFRGVLTEQGQKIATSCADEETSLRNVAAAERAASVAVFGKDTAAEMKTEYDKGVAAINDVHPIRAPEFLLGATPLGSRPDDQQLSVTSVTVRADHPIGSPLSDNVSLRPSLSQNGKKLASRRGLTVERVQTGTQAGVAITFDTAIWAGQTVDVEFVARSMCGPSMLNVRVIVASA